MLQGRTHFGVFRGRAARDPFMAIRCPALRTSLREVSAEWGGHASIDDVLVRLALRLDHSEEGSVPSEGSQKGGDPRFEVGLLKAIRRDLLEQWHRRELPVDEDRVLGLLHAIDLQVEELSDREGEDLEAKLAEPDAFGLVAEVAHDLRSPLTSILFLSDALRNGHSGSLTELQQRQLGLIYSAALGLTGVVNDLMSIAHDQTSGTLEEASAFSLAQTFEAVREMVAPVAEAKRIALRFDIRCFDHRIGHAGPLGRVLLNLITNAIRFTPEGGSVDVLAESVVRDMVEISVRDTGRGIPPEVLAQLFQPFQRANGCQGLFFAPSGLGLSIVRGLLEKMDSELNVESELEHGTRFSFVLDLPAPN